MHKVFIFLLKIFNTFRNPTVLIDLVFNCNFSFQERLIINTKKDIKKISRKVFARFNGVYGFLKVIPINIMSTNFKLINISFTIRVSYSFHFLKVTSESVFSNHFCYDTRIVKMNFDSNYGLLEEEDLTVVHTKHVWKCVKRKIALWRCRASFSVDTRHCFNVYKTSMRRRQRRIDIL